jgi:hypothetical protein
VAELKKVFQSVVIIEMALAAARGRARAGALRPSTVLSGAPPTALPKAAAAALAS